MGNSEWDAPCFITAIVLFLFPISYFPTPGLWRQARSIDTMMMR